VAPLASPEAKPPLPVDSPSESDSSVSSLSSSGGKLSIPSTVGSLSRSSSTSGNLSIFSTRSAHEFPGCFGEVGMARVEPWGTGILLAGGSFLYLSASSAALLCASARSCASSSSVLCQYLPIAAWFS